MYAGSKYESHYTVWTAWISIRVRVRVRVYFILENLAPPGTTVHVPTATNPPSVRAYSVPRFAKGCRDCPSTPDGTCTRDPNMNLIIQYGLLGLVLGLGLGLGFILY